MAVALGYSGGSLRWSKLKKVAWLSFNGSRVDLAEWPIRAALNGRAGFHVMPPFIDSNTQPHHEKNYTSSRT